MCGRAERRSRFGKRADFFGLGHSRRAVGQAIVPAAAFQAALDFGHSCGRQSCLQAAFPGRRFRYATNFSGFAAGCCETSRRNACELQEWSVRRRPERPPAGMIACHTRVACMPRKAKLQSRLSGGSQTLSTGDGSVLWLVSCKCRDGKPEKFVRCRASRLQPGLAAPQRAKATCTDEPLLRTWRGHSCLQRRD
jgi:hypothetical protein